MARLAATLFLAAIVLALTSCSSESPARFVERMSGLPISGIQYEVLHVSESATWQDSHVVYAFRVSAQDFQRLMAECEEKDLIRGLASDGATYRFARGIDGLKTIVPRLGKGLACYGRKESGRTSWSIHIEDELVLFEYIDL